MQILNCIISDISRVYAISSSHSLDIYSRCMVLRNFHLSEDQNLDRSLFIVTGTEGSFGSEPELNVFPKSTAVVIQTGGGIPKGF